MRKHWTSNRTSSKNGKVQSIFNFCYNQDLKVFIQKIVNQILKFQFKRFKLNYRFAYILKNIDNGKLCYYHAFYNNNIIMETAPLIGNRQELTQFLSTLAKESFFDKINRPDTKWQVLDINNITFYVNHIKDIRLGTSISLSDYIKNNHGLRNVSSGDNLCFFLLFGCTPSGQPSLM